MLTIKKLMKLDIILTVIGIFCAIAAIVSIIVGAIYNSQIMYYFYSFFMLTSITIFLVAKFIIYKKIIKRLGGK